MKTTRVDDRQWDPQESLQDTLSSILPLRDYLTVEEESQIHIRFLEPQWKHDSQVLWSGMQREQAQIWADEHGLQTLTTAMGALMDQKTSLGPKKKKQPKRGWSKYIHGASAIFAWHIARGSKVTVLCPPPPQRFHPSGLSSFQTIEEPILRAAIAKGASLRIELVHPGVKEAQDFHYLLWPVDETDLWIAAYDTGLCFKCKWRHVSSKRAIACKAPKNSEGKEECIVSKPVPKEMAIVKAISRPSKKKEKKTGTNKSELKKEKKMGKKEKKLEKKEKKTASTPQLTTPTSYTPPSDCIASKTQSKTQAAERSGLTIFSATQLVINKPNMLEDTRKISKANRQGCKVVEVPQTKEPVTSKKLSKKKKKKKKAKQAKNAKEITKG